MDRPLQDGGRNQNEPGGRQRDAQDLDRAAGQPELPRGAERPSVGESAARLTSWKETRRRPEPGGTGPPGLALVGWGKRKDADERLVADHSARRDHAAVTNERAPAEARRRQRHPAPLDPWRAEQHLVGDGAFIAHFEEVGRHREGGRELDGPSELRSERSKPRRERSE